MPLPGIRSGKTKLFKAKCKARGGRCLNPAAWGRNTLYESFRAPKELKCPSCMLPKSVKDSKK
ncbi:MAG: hypothetical protein RLZZ136_1261 [Pseudomonadota bacterium]|jgi:hypothetical protein